eukprot:scaffold28626_cov80-Skeletonema_marinoi.AAC.1
MSNLSISWREKIGKTFALTQLTYNRRVTLHQGGISLDTYGHRNPIPPGWLVWKTPDDLRP